MKLGDTGGAVRAWQVALNARGAQLVVDGVFGRATHNATIAWQAAHGLPITGQMSALEIVQASSTPSIRPPPTLAHTIPLVEARHYLRQPRAVVDLIVLHCMEAPETSTTAEACAQYIASLPADLPADQKKSCHYCCDSDSVVQCVPDHCVAYAAPGCNHSGLHLELAGYTRQTRGQWLDAYGTRMLWLAAQLTARKCSERHIPVVYLPAAELLGPRPRGITTHCEVSRAFKRSDHTDPGPGFPMDHFIAQTQLALDALEGLT